MNDEETINLKDDKGRIVSVETCSCYSPLPDGTIVASVGGFGYFSGKITQEKATHTSSNHPDLRLRGTIIPIITKTASEEPVELEFAPLPEEEMSGPWCPEL